MSRRSLVTLGLVVLGLVVLGIVSLPRIERRRLQHRIEALLLEAEHATAGSSLSPEVEADSWSGRRTTEARTRADRSLERARRALDRGEEEAALEALGRALDVGHGTAPPHLVGEILRHGLEDQVLDLLDGAPELDPARVRAVLGPRLERAAEPGWERALRGELAFLLAQELEPEELTREELLEVRRTTAALLHGLYGTQPGAEAPAEVVEQARTFVEHGERARRHEERLRRKLRELTE